MHLPRPIQKGEIYIGVLIAIGVFLIVSQAIVILVFSVYDFASFTRARTAAKHLAQEQIEQIRNAQFTDVGTVGGIPNGIFPQEEVVPLNGSNYVVRTRINYIDDPFDGVAPIDTLPVDYKRVRVDVSWGGIAAPDVSKVTVVSDVAPRGIETTAGGGTLAILVFDSQGEPVGQAEVQIEASSLVPPVSATYFTSDTGIITIPGAPVCDSCYAISATKSGFSSDRTYSVTEVENPIKPHASVIESELTEISFTIDEFASLAISTVGSESSGFPPLGGQVVRIHGEKIIGTDGLDSPVYKFDQDIVTDSGGNLSIDEIEWDNYHANVPSGSSYDIASSNPVSPFSLNPADSQNLVISIISNSTHSLKVIFQDPSLNLLASVSATLSDGLGYIATESSGLSTDPDHGQVFFANLESKLYTLTASVSGFLEAISDINVSGDTVQTVIMNTE